MRGTPKAQARPRAFARRVGNSFVARVFDAGSAEEWKSLIALEVRPFCASPFSGPVALALEFTFARPKKHFGARGLKPDAPVNHTSKPDLDNLSKAVMDCLTQCGVWTDDSLVCSKRARKMYGDVPGCRIAIREADEEGRLL